MKSLSQSTGDGKSKIVHTANRVESFVLVQATLVPNEKTSRDEGKIWIVVCIARWRGAALKCAERRDAGTGWTTS